ncbi:hypothetical protein PFISCL1PPCAC_28287, partial [Pristionchus fissidentatus]
MISISDYVEAWHAFIPMFFFMALAPLIEAYFTLLIIIDWIWSLEGLPDSLPSINLTAWIIRLPHVGVSILFAMRLVEGYRRAKEQKIEDACKLFRIYRDTDI